MSCDLFHTIRICNPWIAAGSIFYDCIAGSHILSNQVTQLVACKK